jgi:hypothetical protein
MAPFHRIDTSPTRSVFDVPSGMLPNVDEPAERYDVREALEVLAAGSAARAWMGQHIRTGRDTVLQFFRAAGRNGRT